MRLEQLEKIAREKLPEPLIYENDYFRVPILKEPDISTMHLFDKPTPFDAPYILEFRKKWLNSIDVVWEFYGLVEGGI